MKALITGGSSGIGKEMAKYLSSLGYDLILVSRNNEEIKKIKFNTQVKIYSYDLSIEENCYKLYNKIENEKIDIIINNAGFGAFGDYKNDNLEKEINMIELNIKCLHILTKLFINNENTKYILNVSSAAGLLKGGPLMSTYYATKSYVTSYSLALYEELKRNKSDKHISILCPGPVNTNFNNRAGVNFNIKGLNAETVAKYAINKMFKKKLIIIPGFFTKIGIFMTRFIPTKLLLKITYNFQKKKK